LKINDDRFSWVVVCAGIELVLIIFRVNKVSGGGDLHWDKGNSQVDPRYPLIALINFGVVKHLFIVTYQKYWLFIAEVVDFFLTCYIVVCGN
jgi:hypothetical protein